jgi:dephospho-CoA kinase
MRTVLTGGIACGKSLIAKFLRELGVQILDADDVVHDLERVGGAAVGPIAARFGNAVMDAQGGVDRAALAKIVFSDHRARHDLEAILHPMVRARLTAFLQAEEGAMRLVVVPLLFESHWDADYDTIICVASSADQQIERMMQTRGYTREQAEARLAVQMSVKEKAARAHWTIHNTGTQDALREEVQRLYVWLRDRWKNSR